MKYYCIFAINKKNPKDILGVCERSFSMSYEKDRVCLWQAPPKDSDYISIPHKEHFKKCIMNENPNKFQYGYNYVENTNVKEQRRKYRKLISDPFYKHYHACGRTNYEYEWHWVNHYAKGILTPPDGYEFFVCRANSKHCPALIDTKERIGIAKGYLPYQKYNYRNAKFKLKDECDRKTDAGVHTGDAGRIA